VAVDPLCRAVQGVTIEAELALWVDGRVDTRVPGSLLFAHFGVTGPAALDLSRHWHRAEGRARRVTLSFTPGRTFEALEAAWVEYAAANPRRGVRTWLGEVLPDRIADVLTTESGLGGAAMSQVPRERRATLLRGLVERDLGVTSTLGYEKAEVTAGGAAVGGRRLDAGITRRVRRVPVRGDAGRGGEAGRIQLSVELVIGDRGR
jgi:predicted flavoprotein YhiN